MKIKLYVPAGVCMACTATKRRLDQRDLEYEVLQAADYPEEVDRLATLAGRNAPLVVTADQVWAGFRPDKIDQL